MTDDRALTPDRTAEYERVLLGCALTAPDVARDLLALVQAPMIADPRLSRAWSALRRVLTDETGPVDLPGAVAAELAGDADEAPSLVELHGLAADGAERRERKPTTLGSVGSMPTRAGGWPPG